jgi:TPR repeat protein
MQSEAHAREELLQRYRDCMLDLGQFDLSGALSRDDSFGAANLEGVEWIAQLAATGHVPAQALLDRSLDDRRLGELHACAPERFEEAASRVARFADWLAFRESWREPPDPEALERWLGLGSAPSRSIAAAMAQLAALGLSPAPSDVARITLAIRLRWSTSRVDPRLAAELLEHMAEPRLQSAAPEERSAGIALLKKAGSLAPGAARRWASLYALAERSGYMQRWLETYPSPSRRSPEALMRAALDYQSGTADGEPDLRSAIDLYEMGLNEAAYGASAVTEVRTQFCLAVARWLGWKHAADDRAAREAALHWLEVAIGRGNPDALAMWLRETTTSACVTAREPEQAIEQIKRYVASEPANTPRKALAAPLEHVLGQAKEALRTGTPENFLLAARWLRIPALLGQAEGQYLLGGLHFNGQGVARDPEAARTLLAAAAAQGHAAAKAALQQIAAASRR